MYNLKFDFKHVGEESGIVAILLARFLSQYTKKMTSLSLLLVITLFLSSCDLGKIKVSLFDKKLSPQHLKTLQTQNVSGGILNQPLENGLYSCEFSTQTQAKVSCDDLDNFVFDSDNGMFNWIPDYQQIGLYEIEITSPSGKKNKLVIEIEKKNEAPEISVLNAPALFEENSSYIILLEATDVNQDPLSYNYECLSANCNKLQNINFDSATKNFSFDTNYESEGSYSFLFKVNDGNLEDSISFNFDIENVNRAPVITALNTVSLSENQTWFSSIFATDPDGDDIAYSCIVCPSGFSVNSTSGLMSWQPNFSQSGTHQIEVSATDGDLSTSSFFSIIVSNVNVAPVLAAIGNRTVSENALLTFVLSATDADGDSLTYSCGATCPTGMSLTGSTVNWTPTYSQSGSYSVTFTTSDGSLTDSETITITVNNTNRAPVLAAVGNKSVNENNLLTFDLSATDPDGDSLTYSCGAICPTGMSLTGTTVNWTPTYSQSGSYSVTFTTSDGSLTDTETITITVNNTNRAPVLAAVGDKSVNENNLLTFDLSATDPDGDSLTYSCGATCPTGMSISGATVNWTPTYSQSGSYSVTFTTSDGTLTDTETIMITVNNTNRAPVLAAVGDKSVNENALLTFDLSATDPDGDSLTYSCGATCPTGMSLTGSTVNWTPTYSQSGSYSVTFITSDGSLTDTETITITVNNTNRAPVLAAIGNRTVNENALLTFTLSATDPDGDSLTYSCGATCPTGMSLTGTTVNWTPTYSQSGSYSVTFTTSDGSLTDTETITITVNNINRAPNLASVSNQTVNENVAITLIDLNDLGDDFDNDGDVITYSCLYGMGAGSTTVGGVSCTGVTGFNFSSSSGEITWTPNYSQSGIYEFKVTGTDGSLENSRVFLITVNNVNRAPVLASIGDKSVNEASLLSFALSATDPDGDSVTYSCGGTCPTGMSILANVVSWTPTYSQSGSYSVTFTTTDGSLSDSETISITVNNVNRAPSLAAISNQTVDELFAITQINANDGGDDLDVDGQAITYSCYYDFVVDGNVTTSNSCTSLSGLSFNTATGVMDWTTILGSAGNFEFRISGSDGSLSSDSIFTITVKQAYPLTLVYRTTGASQSIALPSQTGYTYNYKVNWGDGSAIQAFSNSTSQTHTYAAAGDYTVRIYGQFSVIYSNGLSVAHKQRLISVVSLGKVGLISLISAFIDCTNLVSFSNGDGDTSNVSMMSGMFNGATSLSTVNFTGFDTSNTVNMTNMFYGNSSLTSLNLSMFNTAQVTNMSFMFSGMTNLTSLNLSSFNTANVTTMSNMFRGASKLISLDLSNFNTSKVTNMSAMFRDCIALGNLNISSFQTGLVTEMANMFQASKLTSLDLSHFNTANVTNMNSMFYLASGLTSLNLSSFNTANVTTMISMFNGASGLTSLDLSNFNTANVTSMTSMFSSASGLTSLNVSSFNTAKVTSMNSMFAALTGLTSLNLSNFNTANVTNMASMFLNSSGLTGINLSSFNTEKVTNMSYMFSKASGLTSLNLGNFDTAEVTSMRSMFEGASGLTSLNISSFNTVKVTDMGYMFYELSGINSLILPSTFTTANALSMRSMFYGMSGLTSLDLSNFNTGNVTDMAYMFYGMSGLTSLDLLHFNTVKVTSLRSMFYQMSGLTSLDLSNFNTANVTDMGYMFYGTSGLTSLDLSEFTMGNVTTVQSMFNGASSLMNLDLTGWGLRNPLPLSTNIFTGTLPGKVVYCDQATIGAAFSITCTP